MDFREAAEKIRDTIDIVEEISKYVKLKKAGRNHSGLCPFHVEKTPSFMVSPVKRMFHCFGCNSGGDVITFLMKIEGLTFVEALERLAGKAGITLDSGYDKSARDRKEELYKILAIAANFYKDNFTKTQKGQNARDYLFKRGISAEYIEKFKIGYSLAEWDSLLQHLGNMGIDARKSLSVGLVIEREKGGYYDRFRNRIMFPIWDSNARVVAFGARAIDDSLPKYINSPETPVYSKSRILFGLNFAKESILKEDGLILVEGYADALMCHQYGFANTAAVSGTSLTEEHVKLITRYTRNATMAFDPDQAGTIAAWRGLDMLFKSAINVKVAILPNGFDPDKYLREFGNGAFQKILDGAENWIDYKFKVVYERYDRSSLEGKLKITEALFPVLKDIPNMITRQNYVRKLSEDLKIEEESIVMEFNRYLRKQGARPKDATDTAGNAGVKKTNVQDTGFVKIERELIGILLDRNDLFGKVRDRLNPGDFSDVISAKAYGRMGDLFKANSRYGPAELILSGDDDEYVGVMSRLSVDENIINSEPAVEHYVKRIISRRLKNDIDGIREKIKEALGRNDEQLANELMIEYQGLVGEYHKEGFYNL